MKKGRGLLNDIINKLPIELHIPCYRFCGPGTKLEERLGQTGINPLDSACKQHDIQYSKYQDLENRHQADLILQQKADERAFAPDASLHEKSCCTFY